MERSDDIVMVKGIDEVYVNIINGPSEDPIDVIFAIAKKSVKIDKPTFTKEYLSKFTREEKIKFILNVAFKMGHRGILEHIYFTMEIWGVSRSMTHQAVRNRIASFLEGSLRYCNPVEEEFRYIVPMDLRGDDVKLTYLQEEFSKDMETIAKLYKKWYFVGKDLGLSDGNCKELGRTVLPQCSCTTYTFTMNVASLIMFLNKRKCVRAEKEFRMTADSIHNALKQTSLHDIFDVSGSHCEQFGYCPEGGYSCGKYPTISQLLDNFHNN